MWSRTLTRAARLAQQLASRHPATGLDAHAAEMAEDDGKALVGAHDDRIAIAAPIVVATGMHDGAILGSGNRGA